MRILSMFVALMLIAAQAIAGGRIAGKVTDGKTGEPVIGATIVVKGTTAGTSTDVDGNFIVNVDAGTYTVQVKYIGYQGKEVDDVKVTEGNTVTLNVTITEAKSTQLQEVVVRSSIKKENINALYTLQKNAPTVSDGISADVIKKSPDRSTGEVLKRVSGTTVQDNKFVIVRGLSDRYNTALVDNAILPSTEPNRKAFSFDIIPASLIDNIVITKAATPDLPGDFAGGVINILTREIPEQNFNSLSLGFGYNTVSTFQEFKSGYKSGTDIVGFDNGDRKLPSSFPTAKEVSNGLSTAKQINAIKSLNNDYSIKTHSALPAINFQGSLGRTYSLKKGGRFGLVAALTYGHSELIIKDQERQYDNYNYLDNSYKYSTNVGGLLNFGYINKKNKLTFKTLYNRVFDDNFLYREGLNFGNTKEIRYYSFDLLQKALFKTSLEGDHQVGKGQSKINWLLSYNRVTNDQPDQRKVSYGRAMDQPNSVFEADNNQLSKATNRLFSDLKENIVGLNLNYSTPFTLFDRKHTLKVGAFGQYRNRDFNARLFGATADPNYPDVTEVRRRPIETLYADDIVNKGAYRLDELYSPSNTYDANSTTTAGYVMLDNKLTEKLRLVWGVRVESFNLKLNSFNEVGDAINIDENWVDVLPSANFTYALTERSNLRASYFRSVARPEFREIAPFSYYDYDLSAVTYGQPNLQRTRIHNADLRYELFPNPGEVFSASVFYKQFDQTIENSVYGENSAYEIQPANFPKARNIGAEVEFRKNLGFIANNGFFKNLTFYTNLAYIDSKVEYDSAIYINGRRVTERPLAGQSNYVINTGLSYSAMEGKLTANLLYNRIGQRLFLVGQGRLGNVYERPRNMLDFQISYNVSKRSEFRLNIKDILNSQYLFYYDMTGNKKYDGVKANSEGISASDDWVLSKYRPGTTFSLTYTYRF